MQKLLEILQSPAWWVSVVLVGLGVNLAAAYLKPRLDKWVAAFSRTRADRVEHRRLQREARINTLRNDTHSQIMTHLEEIRCRIRAFQNLFGTLLIACSAGGAFAMSRIFEDIEPGGTIIAAILGVLTLVIFLLALDDTRIAVRIQAELRDSESPEANNCEQLPVSSDMVESEIPLSEQLRSGRQMRQLTQEQVATDLGVTQSLISRIERGLTDPNPSTLQRIQDFLFADSHDT